MNNPYLLTLPQLMSAKKKIGRVAAFFDPTKTSLKGFEATVLTPTEFREQLRRGLDIIVTNAELGALVFLFDKTGDGVVDCVEFTNEFYRLGKLERTKFTSSQMDEAKRIKEWKAKNKEIKAKRFEHFNYTHVATSWTEDQENEAIRKIARVAFSYDSLKDSAGMQGFMMSNYITASEFKELMRRNFEVNLTPEETGALLNMFDRGGIGLIDCKEFIYQFFRIGRTQKEEHNHRNNSIAAMRAEMEKERLMQIEEKYSKAVVARMVPATEKDRQSAFDKIRLAALCYKGDSAFSGNLWKSFESDCLDPTAFKSLLKTNFEILLSPGELSALVSMFDANGDGSISCVEFISTFFRIALNERSHRMAIKREKDYQLQREREERIKLKEASAVAGTQTKVVWPLLPDDNGDFPEVSVDSSHVPGPAVADLKTMLKHRARPSMQSILSPVRGGGAPSAGSAPISSSSSSSHKHSQSMADMFPKASQDTKDFLMQLEQQERAIRLMGRSGTVPGDEATNTSAGGKSVVKRRKKGKKTRSQQQHQLGDEGHLVGQERDPFDFSSLHNSVEEVEYEVGTNLLDSQWGFAQGSAGAPKASAGEFSRPSTSQGDYGPRAMSSAGGSRGGGALKAGSSNKMLTREPSIEEFGCGVSETIDIPINVAAEEVADEDC